MIAVRKCAYAVELVAVVVQPLSFNLIVRVAVHLTKII